MVNEFCGFKHGVIGTDTMPADTTLNNMKKADLIKLLHTAQHNYESLMWFYNNAVKANMSQLNNGGWIPCSERLPIVGMTVLCFWKQDNRHANMTSYYYTLMHRNEDCQWISNLGMCNGVVLAWQPLPTPYMEKGKGDKCG